jgi:hypothetical protein
VKKRRVILASVVLLVLGGIFWFALHREQSIQGTGDLPAKDLAEIKRIVRGDLRARFLPHFSWSGIKKFPGEINRFSQIRISRISVVPGMPGEIMVKVAFPADLSGRAPEACYHLQKGPGRWQILNRTIYGRY